jgi:hypothetical protein
MINIQEFLSSSNSVKEMIEDLNQAILTELKMEYSQIIADTETNLIKTMKEINLKTDQKFIILIDEWDCIFREYKNDLQAQESYLDYLRLWLKDQIYVGLAYMTGILPIKKYGSHSALNMFSEFSMIDARQFSPFFGFTETEVLALCEEYGADFEEVKAWYDGYKMEYRMGKGFKAELKKISLYSPKSVVDALTAGKFGTYWNKTETYEALKQYIRINLDGLKDSIVTMLAGGSVPIETSTFTNDMTTFKSQDDVLTLLVHLGYLAYDENQKSISIPNKEVRLEYENAVRILSWTEVSRSIQQSKKLLEAVWQKDEEAVANGIEQVHQEVSILQYNDENALSYTIGLAFYFAREYYTVFRELPSGKGFADIVMIPRINHADKPALLIELKWDKNARGAIDQILNRQYVAGLQEYQGDLLLVGINYDKKRKTHQCKIEKWKL